MNVLKAVSPEVMLKVLRILNTCGLVSLISWLFFVVLNWWIDSCFIFEPCS
jgi:hypothetical protein